MTNLRDIARRAMIEHGLQPDFPGPALAELGQLETRARAPQIRDLRHLPWCSIDNDESRDLDQLTVAQPSANGETKILVAIADVDALVKAATEIDKHAQVNTTSVYTAAGIFPMLPERLSTDLTSLNEGEARFAIVIEFAVGNDGRITAPDVYRANVLNHARLTYDAVAEWLDGNGPTPAAASAVPGLDEQLRIQDAVAQQLRSRRRAQGALDFATTQPRPVLKEKQLIDLRADQQNRAKDLIEDFMVTANGVVARFLQQRGRASIRRCLRSPERWSRIVALATEHGGRLPAEPSSVALNDFLETQKRNDPDGFGNLSLAIIKLLGSGEYAVDVPTHKTAGHFGLATDDYTHATAPNRRYPDLLTQRMIKAALTESAEPYSVDMLKELAAHCNEQERAASKVERQVRKAATAVLLAPMVGKRFNALVTGASPKGTWARIDHPLAEGKVVRNFAGLDVGDRITVELLDVNEERGFIDFGRV